MVFARIYGCVDADTVGIQRCSSFFKGVSLLLLMGTALSPFKGSSQKSMMLQLPDVQITGNKVTKGDGDTYGLGDWHCRFKAMLEGAVVVLEGELIFSENANDFTTIVGTVRRRIKVPALEACRHCRIVLDEPTGWVGGLNIGARGAQWYKGQGLIRRAKMTTDTFGEDVGRVGGTVQFAPLRVLVHCDYALH